MVSPMEQGLATAFLRIVSELEKNYKLWKGVPGLSESLRRDLDMLACAMDDASISRDAPRTAVARAYGREIRDLMHDIEDCIERFHHRVACKKGASWAPLRRIQYAKEIKELKKRLEEARNRVFDRLGSGQSSTSAADPAGRRGCDPIERNPVGMAKPKEELLTLLDGPKQLRVISIVGFGGSGKTTLASTVFEYARGSFHCSAWVDRSDYNNARGLLKKIIQQVSLQWGEDGIHKSEDQRSLQNYLKDHLKNKRYLIVIDDIDLEHWRTIRSTFEDNGTRSRIIVTTAIVSVAKVCSDGNGYVHRMRKLGEEYSEKIALNGRRAPELVRGSADLLKKCDGLPLALVSVADHLRSENEPTGQLCAILCRHLGLHMEDNPNFARLQNMLMDNYISLRDYAARTCLLYLGIFPNDCSLKRNVIIRRWLAEGYAQGHHHLDGQQVADGIFKTFVDRNIIMPVGTSSNGVLKTCKSHGVVHEFVLHKSMSEKFIMSFDTPRDENVRHLFVHHRNGTNCRATLDMDLKRVRSLTVFGNAGDAISDFGNYELMRVLDLEQCSDVNNGHLKGICKLWNMRYLSLGDNITVLPKEIARLQLLETLHVSKMRVTVLPVEVIRLPCLIHLIGKFKLPDQARTVSNDLEKLSKSNLETLVGFVANDQSQVFLQHTVHMKKLRKVKIWCEFTGGSGTSTDHLSGTIRGYMGAHKDCDDVRSLSIDFEKCSEQHQNFLQSLEAPCYLSSLKLHGELPTLPPFVTYAQDLIELCLSSTTLTKDVLSAVSNLANLLYLKLTTDHLELEDFVIQVGAFKSLRRLSFVVHTPNPVFPAIQDGALPKLVSLQLLCKRLDGLSGMEIKHLKDLQEVALHPEMTAKARKDWEAAARKHPNRPKVLFFGRVAVEESTHETPIQRWACLLIPLLLILVWILK